MKAALRGLVIVFVLWGTIALGWSQLRIEQVRGGRKVSVVDSLGRGTAVTDTTTRDTTDFVGSTARADDKLKAAAAAKDSARLDSTKIKRKSRLSRDSISAGNFTLLSLIPGVGQAYNKQYWKIPVFYGAAGGFLAAGIITGNSYQGFKREYQRTVDLKLPLEIRNAAQRKMQSQQSLSTVMYSAAAITYLYAVADATFNFKGETNHIRKATILAAIFPGAGFIYTRTYWRIPIYYGGFLALGTVIDYNNRSYERYRIAYNNLMDGDPTTIDEFNGRYSELQLKNARDSYHRNRDFGIIAIVAAYALSIIDTHVIATLKNWDVTPDLSIRVEPTIIDNSIHRASSVPQGAGLSLKIRF